MLSQIGPNIVSEHQLQRKFLNEQNGTHTYHILGGLSKQPEESLRAKCVRGLCAHNTYSGSANATHLVSSQRGAGVGGGKESSGGAFVSLLYSQ